jgi:hypothetical protein
MVTLRSFLVVLVVCVAPALVLSGCEDPAWGRQDPLIATDTVELAAPTAGLPEVPSALDVIAVGGFIQGGRFPERVADANQGWDLAVRVREGRVVFVPSSALGFESRAGWVGPVQGQTFEGLREVPAGARFETQNAMVIEPGAIYVIRSREFTTGFMGRCAQFAKLQALEVDAAAGTVSVQIASNERCFDTRLVPES